MEPLFLAPPVAVVLAVAGVGAYFAVSGAGSGEEAPTVQAISTPTPSPTEPTPTPTPAPELTPTPALAETSVDTGMKGGSAIGDQSSEGWTTYVDPELGFSFPYRSDWTISTDYYDIPAKEGNPAVQ
jgi:hypothetical protein